MKRKFAPEKNKPLVVKSGNVAVKIYCIVNRGREMFTLSYRGTDGRRIRQNFAKLDEAQAAAQVVANRIQNGQLDVLQLTGADRRTYLRALELIAPTRVPLEAAASEYVQAHQIIGNAGSVIEAARFFAKHHPVALPKRTVQEVYEEFLKAKVADRASKRYLEDIRSRLGRFAIAFPNHIAEISTQDLDNWMAQSKTGAVARNGTRALVITMFNFAKQRGYLPKAHPTEAEGMAKAKEAPSAIGIFTPTQMSELLESAKEDVLPYLAIGGFSGLRHAELMRLDWSEIRLSQQIIEVTAGKAKTAQRRIVPMQENLTQWLQPFSNSRGSVAVGSPTRFLNKVTTIAKRCGFDWPHNALRHSYASYRLAQCKNAAEVALEMGNSPRMVFQHYRELVTPADAAKWWSIAPAAENKIVSAATQS